MFGGETLEQTLLRSILLYSSITHFTFIRLLKHSCFATREYTLFLILPLARKQNSPFRPKVMMWASAGVMFAIVLYSDVTLGWVNINDGPLHFECPMGEYLNRLESHHSNNREDRVWNFECREGFVSEKCHWSDHDTLFDKFMNFTCEDESIVAGLSSWHSNKKEDRSWRFKCCSLKTRPGVNCLTTDYINDWDSYMDFTINDGLAIRGFESQHSNKREDRRWKLHLCEYSICTAIHMEVISQIEEPRKTGTTIVGIVTSQGCSPGISYTIGLNQQIGMEETYSISDTKEHSFVTETSITVGFTVGVPFVAQKLNFELTQSFSYGYTFSKTVTNEMGKSFFTGSSQELEYQGTGAALIVADCHKYELDQTNVEVEYTVECDNGNTYKEKSEVYISANTYGQIHYMQKHATFPEGSCSATSEACIDGIRGKYAVSPEVVIHDFENCVEAVNGTVN